MTLAQYLKREGMSQTAFSQLSGVTQSRINAICSGEGTTAMTALLIMNVAPEVTLLDLVGDSKREYLERSGFLVG